MHGTQIIPFAIFKQKENPDRLCFYTKSITEEGKAFMLPQLQGSTKTVGLITSFLHTPHNEDLAAKYAECTFEKRYNAEAQTVDIKNLPFKTIPTAYQLETLERSHRAQGFFYFWEVGLGKSKAFVDQLCLSSIRGQVNAAVIFCPKSLISSNWPDQFASHYWETQVKPYKLISVFGFPSTEFMVSLFQQVQNAIASGSLPVIICSHGSVRSKFGNLFFNAVFSSEIKWAVCIDEVHKFSDPATKQTKAMVEIGKKAAIIRGCTGSQWTEGRHRLYPMASIVTPGAFPTESIKAFRLRYTKGYYDSRTRSYVYGSVDNQREHEFKEIVSKIASLYRKKDVKKDLPEKIYITKHVNMSPIQQEVYEGIIKQIQDILEAVGISQGEKQMHLLAIIMKLRQVCSGRLIFEPGSENLLIEKSIPKMEALIDIIDQLDGKIIVWCSFTLDIRSIEAAIREAFPKTKTFTLFGETKPEVRGKIQSEFLATDNGILIANPAVGGEGLNLNGVPSAIYYSMDWSGIKREQSEGRNHRMNTADPVTYFDLLTDGGIDNEIYKKVKGKLGSSEMTSDEVVEMLQQAVKSFHKTETEND